MALTSDGNRHMFVDSLRGFALLGIVLVNIEFIVQPSEIGWLHYSSASDRAVRWLVVALGQTKIYPLFALLFGYGLTVQLNRSVDGSGSDLWLRYRRRMIGIGLLGVLHGVMFFPGDILAIYAVIGAFSFRFRNKPSKTLITTGAAVYATATAGWLILGAFDAVAYSPVAPVSADAVQVLGNGSFGEVVVVHFFYWLVTLAVLTAVQGPAVFASFLVGIALGRTNILAEPSRHRERSNRALRWSIPGLCLAAVGATLSLLGGRWDALGFAVGFGGAPLVASGYIAGLAHILARRHRLSALLQAAGRMSLTVYLLESVVASTIAYGYGLGRFGETGPLAGVAIAGSIWLTLSGFAFAWMRYARFGPFEWALRSFTYGQRAPLRADTSAQRNSMPS